MRTDLSRDKEKTFGLGFCDLASPQVEVQSPRAAITAPASTLLYSGKEERFQSIRFPNHQQYFKAWSKLQETLDITAAAQLVASRVQTRQSQRLSHLSSPYLACKKRLKCLYLPLIMCLCTTTLFWSFCFFCYSLEIHPPCL